MKYPLFLCLMLSLLLGCHSKEEPVNSSINGVWESLGSGWILEIQDSSRYALYDVTSISCITQWQSGLDELLGVLKLEQDTLSLQKGVIDYRFVRRSKLPVPCLTELSYKQEQDPIYNFEVFAETVEEHYAFLELNDINWDKLYAQQKAKLHEDPTAAKLYLLIEETLELLKDNHAFLEAPDSIYTAIEALASEEEEEGLPEYGDFQIADLVSKHHLDEELTKDSWLVRWGKMNDSIGYVQIKAMWLFADLELSDSLIKSMGYVDAYVHTFHQMYEGDYIDQEVAGVRKIMDQVMTDLADAKAMVIDVRFNGGGQDAVSFEILSRFVKNQIQVATQKLRYGDYVSPTLRLFLKGVADPYVQPVYVLTSPQTGSAAESFSIATIDLANVKRIGSPTAGAMSTALEKKLPNGWTFSISNEIFMDNRGNNYENIGIPVDHDLNYPKGRQEFFRAIADDLKKDKEDILKGIRTLEGK